MVRSEEQLTDVELNEVSYAEEAADFIIDPEPEMEAELLRLWGLRMKQVRVPQWPVASC